MRVLKAAVLLARPIAVCCAFGLAGCGSAAEAPINDEPADVGNPGPFPPSEPRPLCSVGSSETNLVFQAVTMPKVHSGSFLDSRNGSPELYVSADCHYWTRPRKNLLEMRGGTLTAEQSDMLGAALRFAEWPNWYGWLGPENIFDGSITVFDDGTGAFGCEQLCEGADASDGWRWLVDDWHDMFATFREQHLVLYDQGQAMTGPMRVRVFPFGSDDVTKIHPAAFHDWPASIPIENVSLPDRFSPPIGGTLVTGEDAVAFRALRADAQALAYEADGPPPYMLTLVGTTVMQIEMDDALPFEDENGLVPKTPTQLCAPGWCE